MLSTILVAVPAFRRVEPAMISGPTAGAIWRSTKFWSSEPGQQVTKMIFAPALRARVSAAAHERRHAARRDADDDILLAEAQPSDAARAFLVVVLDPFLRAEDGLLSARHDGLDERRARCRRSAASRPPRRRRGGRSCRRRRRRCGPPLRSAWVMISTPCAIRSFSFWTAAMTLRSSLTTMSMMSGTAALSTARLTGLMASVGSDCHFDCVGMKNVPSR